MLAAPSAAIDLPLKILVAADAQGKVWISYNSPDHLKERHGSPSDFSCQISPSFRRWPPRPQSDDVSAGGG